MTIESVKQRILELYKSGETIHVSVTLTHPKQILTDAPARITNVYPNIFTVTKTEPDTVARYTLRYTEILVGHVKIKEITANE